MAVSYQPASIPRWSPLGRAIVFALAATSILCLLADFYGLCPMRPFTFYILIPAMMILVISALADWKRGDHRLCSAVVVGAIAGLVAAAAYDVFRMPFVFAQTLGIQSVVPALKLFKVFPRFGAMILGEPIEQQAYSLAAHLIGWVYHFSNGITFGVMYVALIGDGARRHWGWGIVFAVGLEIAMLVTPYANVFSIHLTPSFVIVTLTAHFVFGLVLGRLVRRWSQSGGFVALPSEPALQNP